MLKSEKWRGPAISHAEKRSLDDWYLTVNRIYLDRNFDRGLASIFAHLVEIVGGLSFLASEKANSRVSPTEYVPKAIAWWMALSGKAGVRSVSDMIWWKYPNACPYCHRSPHDQRLCDRAKRERGLDWGALDGLAGTSLGVRPHSLPEWQEMFLRIYPVAAVEQYSIVFARFSEELGELGEAVRVFPVAPSYFLSEAADTFAWLMHLQNLIEIKGGVREENWGEALEQHFIQAYADKCSDCGNPVCNCPPILPKTLGRIAHEAPEPRASFSEGGALLPIDEAMRLFKLGSTTIDIAGESFEVDADFLSDVKRLISELTKAFVTQVAVTESHWHELGSILERLNDLASAQRITQEGISQLAATLAKLPSEERQAAVGVLSSLAAGPWIAAFIELIKAIAESM